MKKALSLILILILALSVCTISFADDPNEIAGTTEMPYAGLRFVPPELYQNTVGRTITDGAIQFDAGIYYAYWVYCAMTEEELTAYFNDSNAEADDRMIILFYVFSIGNGMTFDDMNAMIDNILPTEYVREIGNVGDTTFYLYMEGPNQEYIGLIDPAYRDEYTALAGAYDDIAAAFTFSEPVDRYASLIGSKVSFATTDLDGKPVSSEDLFAQHEITMVNIWATWCGPCIGELAELQQIHVRLQEKDCGIVGLLDDEDLDSARELVTMNGISYPIILAPDNLYDVFPIEAYPSSFFVGRDGTILAAPIVGAYVDIYESTLDSLLQK